jgi:hypothetical protein
MDAYRRGVAAILQHLGLDSGMCAGHKEYAPGRKLDPSFDMSEFRARVKSIMEAGHPASLIPPAEPHDAGSTQAPPRSTLRRGDRGERVKDIQTRLGLQDDGIFGGRAGPPCASSSAVPDWFPMASSAPKPWAALDSNRIQSTPAAPASGASRPDSRRAASA